MSCWCKRLTYICTDCEKERKWNSIPEIIQHKILIFGKLIDESCDDLKKMMSYSDLLDDHDVCISDIPESVNEKFRKVVPVRNVEQLKLIGDELPF